MSQPFDADVRARLTVESLRDGRCPFCERGPFVVVACHIAHAHGILAQDIRDMLGVGRRVSIADPRHSDKCRDHVAAVAPTVRLDEQTVVEMRTLYASGEVSQDELARRYGVSQSTVSHAVLGDGWASHDGPIAKRLTLGERGRRSGKFGMTRQERGVLGSSKSPVVKGADGRWKMP